MPVFGIEQVELAVLAGRLRLAELRAERRMRLEHVAVRVHVDRVTERRVRGRAVVALEEVLGDDLPVRVGAELDARVKDEVADVEVAAEDLRQLAEVLYERPGVPGRD